MILRETLIDYSINLTHTYLVEHIKSSRLREASDGGETLRSPPGPLQISPSCSLTTSPWSFTDRPSPGWLP